MTACERRGGRFVRSALLAKEWRENLAALFAGACIFGVVPALWATVYAFISPRDRFFPGMGAWLLIGIGWLFGALLGAQAICRDFGRAEGRFLLALPVRAGQAVRAKLAAGLLAVTAVAAVVWLYEGALALMGRALPGDEVILERLIVGSAGALLAFLVGFAAAALTRRATAAVMIAGAATALLFAVPMLSGFVAGLPVDVESLRRAIFGDTYTTRERWSAQRWATIAIALAALLMLLAASGAAAWAIATSAVRSERRAALRGRHAGVALVLVAAALLITALREVGGNVPIGGAWWYPVATDSIPVDVAIGRERICVLGDVQLKYGFAELLRLSPEGAVLEARRLGRPEPSVLSSWSFAAAFDKADALWVVGLMPRVRDPARAPASGEDQHTPLSELAALRAWRYDEQVGSWAAGVTLPFPSSTASASYCSCSAATFYGDELWLTLWEWKRSSAGRTEHAETFAVYRLSGGSEPELVRSAGLNRGPTARPNGITHFSLRKGKAPVIVGAGWTFDPTTEDGVPVGFNWKLGSPLNWMTPIIGDGICASASRDGLLVYTEIPPRPGATWADFDVTTLPAPFISRPFRTHSGVPVPSGERMLWEPHYERVVGYDVSDPRRPRRVAHVSTYPIREIFARGPWLVVDHGFGLTIVKSPR